MATNYPTSSVHQAPTNVGNHAELHVEGYPKLAFFFSQCARYLHLRRFSAIAVRLLLYRQHELIALEENLIELEARDFNSGDDRRRLSSVNFAHLKAEPSTPSGLEQRQLYETLKLEMKEYEEAIIRFNRLGSKGYDVAGLRTVQAFQDKRNMPLFGLDASVWGSLCDPESHAFDIIQVVEQSNPSAIGRFFRDKILLWAPRLPEWLWILFFWSKKRPDAFHQYRFSGRAFEVASLALGNIATSLLVYAAVTSLYFANAGKVLALSSAQLSEDDATTCEFRIQFRSIMEVAMRG
ncbi:uncharacterized protein K460DRAFT_421472 [Cucurbitaria berberidis CBS 394.84]|uniref:DUF6594 domain-containing protein n=1 Tax=Cucurbitaria berberidis CBS 394.84 TaxID=1168544 RepID=A0A9P4L454_9PLEO|nr:uncharacterized protein K460DRAFT_421472 [Cucurbitaria berberidis CBS 394.84]KAF1840533.1 hypothetical protein K460DRAFT_421472 [Cucurbitaria berberidis CBS 394.84]